MSDRKEPRSVREPLQIYMAPDERRLLDTMAEQTGLSRAEVLRQGLRKFAAEQAGSDGPVQTFMRAMREKALPADIAEAHDDYLARAWTDRHEP